MKPARSKQVRYAAARSRSGSLNQDPVEVFCRVRPLKYSSLSCLTVLNQTTVKFSPPESAVGYRNGSNYKEVQHTFREVFDERSLQKDIFEKVGLNLVKQLIAGKNGLLFTYGVTGSGKTFTMTGEPQNPGVMPRCLEVIFNSIANFQAKKHTFRPDKMNGFDIQDEEEVDLASRRERADYRLPKTPKTPRRKDTDADFFLSRGVESSDVVPIDEDNMYSCFVTYVEIYNNSVFDLLDVNEDAITRKLQNKVIREDANKNMYVHGVTEVEVKSPEDAFEVFSRGQRRKRVANTLLNEESSRSHSIFTIRLVQAPLEDTGEDALLARKLMTISQLALVDLAGSERTNRTKNTGDRLREAGNINNSLMTLRKCLKFLRENQQMGSNKIVPYRDSKLTHLFKNYFDGEGAVRMIVCVNPRVEDYEETAHVLKFAELTQEVQVTRPVPLRIDVGLTPGRRRAQQFKRDEAVDDTSPPVLPRISLLQPWPSLEIMGPNDSVTLRTLEDYLIHRQTLLSSISVRRNQAKEDFRRELMRLENDFTSEKENNIALRGLLELERKKSADNDSKLAINGSERYELLKKLSERDQLIRTFQSKIEDRELIIIQQGLEKDKIKDKCQKKLQQRDKKLREEGEMKIIQGKEEFEEEMRRKDEKIRHIKEVLADTPCFTPRPRRADYPLTLKSVNTAGTLYQVPTSARGPTTRHPRPRRSRSAGGGDRWLDHRPVQPVDLNTVLQPLMRKRKSISKLTDMKDVVNTKTSKYCLTTQDQDTDGELETKLYKGDVIPTCSGGAQVVLNDVETLKQFCPTNVTLRKRSVPDENVEVRCRMALEGHGKRSRH